VLPDLARTIAKAISLPGGHDTGFFPQVEGASAG
jgi:alkaline phosphatase